MLKQNFKKNVKSISEKAHNATNKLKNAQEKVILSEKTVVDFGNMVINTIVVGIEAYQEFVIKFAQASEIAKTFLQKVEDISKEIAEK